MSEGAYERLTGLDHAFLHFETPTTYMHVGLTAVFGPGSVATADGGIDFERVRRHVASRLPLLKRYRQRLHYMPVTDDPVWIDDPDFKLEYHVRHSHLACPGTDEQLKTLIGRILERPLDRRRPLWEMWMIEGLREGRFAMLCKVHHCMVDGIAGMELIAALLSPIASDQTETAEAWTATPAPSGAHLLRNELRRRSSASFALARKLPALLAQGAGWKSLWGLARTGLERAAETPINRPIGPHRRVEWVSFDLAEIKQIKSRLGGTVNDVVLAVVSGAVRRLLTDRGAKAKGVFRALVPVSTRSSQERGAGGNRVSAWITPLPVDEPDVLERYRRISRTAAGYRSNHEERAASVLVEGAELAPARALEASIRLISQARVFNLIVTNVPGPQFPLYLLDAPMLEGHPHVPLFTNQGLGIALLSYCGRLSFGLVGDWDVVADLDRVARWIEDSFREVRELARTVAECSEESVTQAARAPAKIERAAERKRERSHRERSATPPALRLRESS